MALSTSTLAELVQRRHDCLGELLSLVRQQRALAASGDLDRLLAVLSQKQPYLEAVIPSLNDPSLAPPGKHVMSIYAQFAPYRLKSGDWERRRDELGDTVLKTLSAYAPDLPGLVLKRQVITPKDLEETYGLTGGHIEHGEQAADQLFTMRPLLGHARYRGPLRGLFLCGAGTHPGGGITGASGSNAAREILKDLR